MNEHEINGNLRVEVQELTVQIAVLYARLDSAKEALSLQANEYERRLETLNHAHQEARDVLKTYGSTYLTIERHDRFYAEFIEWRRKVDEALTEIRASTLRYAAIITVIFTAVTLFLQVWRGFPH